MNLSQIKGYKECAPEKIKFVNKEDSLTWDFAYREGSNKTIDAFSALDISLNEEELVKIVANFKILDNYETLWDAKVGLAKAIASNSERLLRVGKCGLR